MNILKLISGSDIRGVAVSGDDTKITLTDDVVSKISAAFEQYIEKKLGKKNLKIAIGNDSRISADRIKKAFVEALITNDITDFSLTTTPSMFVSTILEGYEFDAAVMITASHHPFDKNGLKFFTRDGGLEHKDLEEIAENAGEFIKSSKEVKKLDFLSIYSKTLTDKIIKETKKEQPLKGFKIVVDAGNGASGYFVDVLKELGADISGSQFLEPDGLFPNHIPNPEDKDAINSLSDAVIKNKANLGIIFDTDGDRAGAVDENGNEINRNRLIALMSAIVLKQNKGAYIVTDSVTSDGLSNFIKEHGGVHIRFKRGYKNVINEMIRLNKEGKCCPLAMETSGHGAFAENNNLDDGAYLMVKLLIEIANTDGAILKQLESLEEPVESVEMRFKINDENFTEYGKNLLSSLENATKNLGFSLAPDNYEGIRAYNEYGWFLLRLSVHDPYMPLNIETNEKGKAVEIAKGLYEFLKQYKDLDIKSLQQMII